MNSEVTLEQLRELMRAADGQLEAGDKFAFRANVDFIEGCATYVRQLLTTPPASGEVVVVPRPDFDKIVKQLDYRATHGLGKQDCATYRKLHDDLVAWLSAAPKQAMGWRDIESAPRDGTRVLLAIGGGNVAIGKWTDGDAANPATATHWQPLPSPPEKAGG